MPFIDFSLFLGKIRGKLDAFAENYFSVEGKNIPVNPYLNSVHAVTFFEYKLYTSSL